MIHNDRTLLWSTSGNVYNTTFDLSEPATHFEAIEVYASGKENDANGVHLSKQTFNTQNHKMGCDCFGYSPWVTGCNYVLGSDFTISGNQCYCGSSYYMGMGNNTTAYAAGKWVNADAQKMLQPIKIFGIDRKPTRTLTLINSDHGTISASVLTGCEFDEVTLSNTPDEGWYFLGYNITGATLTGNKFTFGNSDVTAECVWTQDAYTITYENDGHGTVTGPETAVPGSTVTLSTAYNTYYRFSGYQITGGSINGNNLTVTGDCTARAVFKPNAFTATGNFEKGSNVSAAVTTNRTTAYVSTKYAVHVAHTGNVPTAWYATSNRWKPTNPSNYTIRLIPKMTFSARDPNYTSNRASVFKAVTLAGSTAKNSWTWNSKPTASTYTKTYTANFTNTNTNVNYGISASMDPGYYSKVYYLSTATTGTWSATGYAP